MEPTQEPTLEESVVEVMRSLPPILRDYLADEKNVSFASDLAARFNLSPEQSSLLTTQVTLLIMGVDTPAEFAQTLFEEGQFDEKTINTIAQAVNEQIFVPLQAQMTAAQAARITVPPAPQPAPAPVEPVAPTGLAPGPREIIFNMGAETAAPSVPSYKPAPTFAMPTLDSTRVPASVPPKAPPPPVGAPTYIPEYPMGTYAPPPQSPRYPNQESANLNTYLRPVAASAASALRPQPLPKPQPAESHLINKLPAPVTPRPAPTPLKAIDPTHTLTDHEEPHIAFAPPATAVPVAAAPIAPVQAPAPVAAAAPVEPVAPPRPYSVDPYHEPIEGQ